LIHFYLSLVKRELSLALVQSMLVEDMLARLAEDRLARLAADRLAR
jgi:hypothetical protein